VIRGGRVFLRRIIDCITSLKRDWHKILLKGEVLAGLSSIVEESIYIPKKVIEVVGSTTFDHFIINPNFLSK
jgi:hypothetical protein